MNALIALTLMSEPTSLDYCERIAQYMWGLDPCTMVEDIAIVPDIEELNFCCGWDSGDCVQVAIGLLCPPGDYLVICEWGRILTDGSIECFDE